MNVRKVLYSPGFGAGWSSWNTEHGRELATDPRLIEFFETGRCVVSVVGSEVVVHEHFRDRCREIYGNEGEPYYGGLRDVQVTTVKGPFRIDEYDGSESVVELDEQEWR